MYSKTLENDKKKKKQSISLYPIDVGLFSLWIPHPINELFDLSHKILLAQDFFCGSFFIN